MVGNGVSEYYIYLDKLHADGSKLFFFSLKISIYYNSILADGGKVF